MSEPSCSLTNAQGTSGAAAAWAVLALTLTQPSLTRCPEPCHYCFTDGRAKCCYGRKQKGFFWLEQNLVWRWIVFVVKDVMY